MKPKTTVIETKSATIKVMRSPFNTYAATVDFHGITGRFCAVHYCRSVADAVNHVRTILAKHGTR